MKSTLTFLAALLLAPLGEMHAAELRLPSIIADHMVLQCDQPVPVWGWGDAGEHVVVEFAGQKVSATADANGKWMIKIDPLAASSMSFRGGCSTAWCIPSYRMGFAACSGIRVNRTRSTPASTAPRFLC